MFVKKEDFDYLENLNKGLDEAGKKRFMDNLRKSIANRAGEEVKKIQVVGDDIFDILAVEPSQFVTRTMIKKAYKAVKEG